MREIINKGNEKLLKRYEMICRNKGLTNKSIEAICKFDIPVFLRHLGEKDLKDVTHMDIEDFIDYCQNERENSPAALDRKYISLNGFFKTLILKDYLDMKNPLDKVDKIKVRKKVRGHLTDDEMKQIFEYIDSIDDLRSGALFSLMFSSGIRLSEVQQLHIATMNFESRRFKVLGKGQKERIAIFSEEAKQRILKYLESRQDDFPYLFISRENNQWNARSIQSHVKNIAKRAGIEKNVFPHLLRHSTAMSLLKKGLALDKIQKVLGHESVATTQVYAHNSIDDVQEMVDALA